MIVTVIPRKFWQNDFLAGVRRLFFPPRSSTWANEIRTLSVLAKSNYSILDTSRTTHTAPRRRSLHSFDGRGGSLSDFYISPENWAMKRDEGWSAFLSLLLVYQLSIRNKAMPLVEVPLNPSRTPLLPLPKLSPFRVRLRPSYGAYRRVGV